MTRLRILLALFLLGIAGGVPALAQAQSAPAAARLPDTDRALVLAKILNSDANIVGTDEDDEKLLALIPSLFGSKEDLAAMEAKYPGISVEMARAMLPIANRSARARLPELWQRQALLYKSLLSPADIERLIAFYSSPTGRKMMESLYRKIKPTAMMEDAKRSDDFRISSESAIKDIRSTVPAVAREMTAEDQRVMMAAFSAPGLRQKMQQLGPKTQELVLVWMNESLPGEDAELEAAAMAVLDGRRTRHELSK